MWLRTLAVVLAVMTTLPICAAKFYVRTDGADTNDGLANNPDAGGTSNQAWISPEGHSLVAGDSVYVQPGVYIGGTWEFTEDGTAENPICIIADGAVTLDGQFRLNGANYIKIVGFTITHSTGTPAVPLFAIAGSSGNFEIRDNYIHHCYNTYLIETEGTGTNNHHGTIIGNILEWPSVGDDAGETAIKVYGGAHRIQNNLIHRTADYINPGGNARVVIMNNIFGHCEEADFPSAVPFPHHIDGTQWINSTPNELSMFARNYMISNTVSEGHLLIARMTGAGERGTFGIIRGNVTAKHGYAAIQLGNVYDWMIYQNTFVDNMMDSGDRMTIFIDDEAGGAGRNVDLIGQVFVRVTDPSTGDVFSYNTGTMTEAEHDYNFSIDSGTFEHSETNGDDDTDPLFTDDSSGDYTLSTGSTLKNILPPITTANGSGSSSATVILNGASHAFFDGFGIMPGDTILVGASVTWITDINRSTHTLTVSPAITWSDEAEVYLCTRSGVKLDHAGAFPYRASWTLTGSYVRASDTFTVTFNAPDLVQRVDFYEDGKPMASDWGQDGSFTYTRSIGSATVVPKAYPFFASKDTGFALGMEISEAPAATLQRTQGASVKQGRTSVQ